MEHSPGLIKCWATKQALVNLRKLKSYQASLPTITLRLEINYKKKKTVKNTNMWRLNNMLLNNQWIPEEIKEEIKKYLETDENESTMIQNLWDAANQF